MCCMPKLSEQRRKTDCIKLHKYTLVEHSTCLVTAAQRLKDTRCAVKTYLHITATTKKHMHASICTHTHKHGSPNSTSRQLLSQRNACTSFPFPEFLFTVKKKEEKPYWNFIFSVSLPRSLSFFLPPLALPKFRNQWGLTVMHMNSSMSHNRATNPHCGSGDSLSYTSNKGKTPRQHHYCQFFSKHTQPHTLLPTPGRSCQLMCMQVCVSGCMCVFLLVHMDVCRPVCVCVCRQCHSLYEFLMCVLWQWGLHAA